MVVRDSPCESRTSPAFFFLLYPPFWRYFFAFFAVRLLNYYIFIIGTLLSGVVVAAEIKVALANNESPHFVSVAENGVWSGFHVDMVNALCAEMQSKCTLTVLAQNKLLTALQNGEIDAIVALPAGEDYETGILQSQRYYKNGARFVTADSNSAKVAYKKMAGQNIGVLQNSIFDVFASEKFHAVNIKRYRDMASAYAALKQDKVDYVLGDRIAQFTWAAAEEGYRTKGPNYSTAKYFSDMVIAVDQQQLLQQFNAALATVRENGTYKEISKRYFPFDIYGR